MIAEPHEVAHLALLITADRDSYVSRLMETASPTKYASVELARDILASWANGDLSVNALRRILTDLDENAPFLCEGLLHAFDNQGWIPLHGTRLNFQNPVSYVATEPWALKFLARWEDVQNCLSLQVSDPGLEGLAFLAPEEAPVAALRIYAARSGLDLSHFTSDELLRSAALIGPVTWTEEEREEARKMLGRVVPADVLEGMFGD